MLRIEIQPYKSMLTWSKSGPKTPAGQALVDLVKKPHSRHKTNGFPSEADEFMPYFACSNVLMVVPDARRSNSFTNTAVDGTK